MRKTFVLLMVLVMITGLLGCGTSKTPSTESAKAPETTVAKLDATMSQLFVDPTWLKANLNNVVVLDARPDKDYKDGHIAGAINVTWQSLCDMSKKTGDPGWGVVLPADQFGAKVGALGINGDKTVIVYAAPPGWGEEGCVAWMLKLAGVKNVKLLDGGFKSWQAQNGEVNKEIPQPKAIEFKVAKFDDSLTATTEWIQANTGKAKIVDSRSVKEYQGATDYSEARGGHLPAAINVPFEGMFNADGTIKTAEALKAIFAQAGLTTQDEIVTYCTAGIRSGHMALVLRTLGFEKSRNYDASFYEWAGNKSLPVEK